jgi:hypothetical protein
MKMGSVWIMMMPRLKVQPAATVRQPMSIWLSFSQGRGIGYEANDSLDVPARLVLPGSRKSG